MESQANKDHKATEVHRLLNMGLDLFGMNRVEEALCAWREVLEIDPLNQEAIDYLESAETSDKVKPEQRKQTGSANKILTFPAVGPLAKPASSVATPLPAGTPTPLRKTPPPPAELNQGRGLKPASAEKNW